MPVGLERQSLGETFIKRSAILIGGVLVGDARWSRMSLSSPVAARLSIHLCRSAALRSQAALLFSGCDNLSDGRETFGTGAQQSSPAGAIGADG